MLTGLSFLAVITKIMVNQVEGAFGYDKNIYIAKTVSERRKERGPRYYGVVSTIRMYLHMSHGKRYCRWCCSQSRLGARQEVSNAAKVVGSVFVCASSPR